jgi:outer membrane lipoprotein SlyB
MNANRIVCSLTVLYFVLAVGCASETGGTFSSNQARVAQSVSFGTITHLANATIENNPSGFGAAAGGVAGGVVGSTIGSGRGSTLAAVAGALLGAGAGHMAEGAARRSPALEITVRLENGQMISVVQELGAEERTFAIGDSVRVLRGSDGTTRVRR